MLFDTCTKELKISSFVHCKWQRETLWKRHALDKRRMPPNLKQQGRHKAEAVSSCRRCNLNMYARGVALGLRANAHIRTNRLSRFAHKLHLWVRCVRAQGGMTESQTACRHARITHVCPTHFAFDAESTWRGLEELVTLEPCQAQRATRENSRV